MIGWIRFDETARPEQLVGCGGRMGPANRRRGSTPGRSGANGENDTCVEFEEVEFIIADMKKLRDELSDDYQELVVRAM